MRHADGAGAESRGGDKGVEPGKAREAGEREQEGVLQQEPLEEEAQRRAKLAPERQVDLHADLKEKENEADLADLPDHGRDVGLQQGAHREPEADKHGVGERGPTEPRAHVWDGHHRKEQEDDQLDARHSAWALGSVMLQ